MSQETSQRLLEHHWPGNVRELENVMRRMVVLSTEQVFDSRVADRSNHAPPAARTPISTDGLREVARNGAREAERKALAEVLERSNWNRAEAARVLKVSYKTLLNKIAECGLKPPPRQP